LQYEVACDEDNYEQDDEHEKNDDEDELWSHTKAGGALSELYWLLRSTSLVLQPRFTTL
jgi:hypothetical protein